MIDSYSFGEIVIDGRRYTRDVIIYQDRVDDGWWREEGHSLAIHDVEEALQTRPEVIVVGTGYSGMMRVPPETREQIESRGIDLVVERTREACRTYNRLIRVRRVAAALHLTC